MFNFAAQNAGLSQPKKKPTKRGRKPSGKPGSDHLTKLQQAHGTGDVKSAVTHALNYANAATKHLKGAGATAADPVDMASADSPPPTAPSAPSSNGRAALAKLAMSRKKIPTI